jgi:hypothetical protein
MISALVLAAAIGAAEPPDFAMFMDSCWVAQFTPATSDRHCFTRILGGTHIRDTHEVKDGDRVIYSGETTYSLDGTTVEFTYFNSLGGVGRGSVNQDSAVFRFKGSMRGSPGKPEQPIDSEWRRLDDDHYDVRSLVPSASTGGNVVIHFSRQK